jgi:hypothetical protein
MNNLIFLSIRLTQLHIYSRAITVEELRYNMFLDSKYIACIEDPQTGQWRDINPVKHACILESDVPIITNVLIPRYGHLNLKQSKETIVLDEGFLEFYNNSFLSDIELEINSNCSQDQSSTPELIIPAHKLILMSRSAYFHAMFSSTMIESRSKRIKLNDVNPSSFTIFLQILYCSTESAIDKVIQKTLSVDDNNSVTKINAKINIFIDILMLGERFELNSINFLRRYVENHLLSCLYDLLLVSYDDYVRSLEELGGFFGFIDQLTPTTLQSDTVEGLSELKKWYRVRRHNPIQEYIRSFK